MKSLNIDNSYSLDNIDNYNKELTEDINDIINKYVNLLKEYLNFVENNIKIRNKIYIKFIIKRGLETITNVFLNILYYTKNLNLTYFHCQKSFYFYVEFIGQITDDQNIYLQLNSRDASTYVYRKTIFEINNEYRKNMKNPTEEITDKFDLLNTIDCCENHEKCDENADYLIKINTKIKNLCLSLDNLNNINLLVNILDNKIEDEKVFIEIILLYLKKINKNISLINKLNNKIKNENLNIYLCPNEYAEIDKDKFVNWLINL
jgi:hypothetical protein